MALLVGGSFLSERQWVLGGALVAFALFRVGLAIRDWRRLREIPQE